jgi:hypothetical protein
MYAYVALFTTFVICGLIDSLLSSVTPSSFTLSCGRISSFPKRSGVLLSCLCRRVKYMRLVLSVSKIAPRCSAYCVACGMIVSWMSFVVCFSLFLTTQALKSSTNPIAPPFPLIFRSTKSAL